MSVLGWFLALFGFVGLVVGVLQMLKGKKLNAVPYRAPGQIAQMGQGAADAKGLVSTEGAVAPQGLLTAPMSGKPCLAYEIEIKRKWEKSERTENGTSTKKGADNIFTDYKGGMFALQDGGGQVWVDASQRPDATFDKAHDSHVDVGLLGVIPGTLQFGAFQMNTPSLALSEGRTLGFEGVERIVPPTGNLYALGALNVTPQGPVLATPKGIGTGKLILSSKGRAQLVKSTKRNMVLGYALGGVLFVGGTGLGLFGPKPDTSASASQCGSTLASDVVACDGRMYEREGYDMAWTVKTAGTYTLAVSQPNVKYPIIPVITVKDGKGTKVAEDEGSEAKVERRFEPGTYSVNVRDFAKDKVKGGYGFHLDITRVTDPAVASASITSGDVDGDGDEDDDVKGTAPKAGAAKALGVKANAQPAAKAAVPAVKAGAGAKADAGASAAPAAAAKGDAGAAKK